MPAELANRTVFVGVPQFDCFAYQESGPKEDRLAVMADHQLHNAGLRGWNAEYRREWVQSLEQTLSASSWRVALKRHPGDREDVWRDADPACVEQVDTIDELAERARAASLVLGTGSTLQLPLIASSGTAAVALEIHPAPGPALSGPLIEAGVAHAVTSFEALGAALQRTAELRKEQAPTKRAFVERFLYRLDGKARERLAAALLDSG